MACALGVKTVSIFGPVDEKVYGPYRPEGAHTVKTADVTCRPCYKFFRYEECDKRVCLEYLKPDDIVEAVRSNLK